MKRGIMEERIPKHLIGLYYPSIQFKKTAWVKLAALYWDTLGRIVPEDYPHKDSDEIRQLIEEAGFIRDFSPLYDDLKATEDLFLNLIRKRGKLLKEHYSILQDNPLIFDEKVLRFSNILDIAYYRKQQKRDAKLTYIASGRKMTSALRAMLVQKGLAQYIDIDDELEAFNFVEMHPLLAFTYMEVLAEQMAYSRKLYPVTDDIYHHHAVGRYTLDRLTNTLFSSGSQGNQPSDPAPITQTLQVCVADIAIQSVLPRNLANVPVKKIIKVREKYRDELTSFQNHLHDFADNLKYLQEIKDPDAISAYLTLEYEKNLKQQVNHLRKCLASLSIDTTLSALNIKVTQPELLSGLMPLMASSPMLTAIGAAGAVVLSVFPTMRKQRQAAKEIIASSPMAYLLHLQEDLEPFVLSHRISSLVRRSIVGA
jgi:hypothetical protein